MRENLETVCEFSRVTYDLPAELIRSGVYGRWSLDEGRSGVWMRFGDLFFVKYLRCLGDRSFDEFATSSRF